jgi:hypothetical protein
VAQHSLVIKCIGVLLLVLLNINLLKEINVFKIPLFYTIIPCLELLKFFFLDSDFSKGHSIQFLVGMSYWLAALVICWIIYSTINSSKTTSVEKTLNFVVLVNFLFSIGQIVRICILEGVLNPYNTGHDHPYGISSGDLIYGIFNGVHITNAFMCVFFAMFYVHKRKYGFLFFALVPLLLCGSNYASIVLFLVLGIYFLLSSRKAYVFKISAVILFVFISFNCLVTPLNASYAYSKIAHIVFGKTIENELLLSKLDNEKRRWELQSGSSDYDFTKESGKKTSFKQTINFISSSPKYFLFGAGMGRFSSELAFNFSASSNHRLIKENLPKYESDLFATNHQQIYSFLKGAHVGFHSESNKPFSTYNQLIGEYGVLGFVLFFTMYIFYFFKRVDSKNYAIPIMLALLFALNLGYYFEQLNLILLFEILMFLNIKERHQVKTNNF